VPKSQVPVGGGAVVGEVVVTQPIAGTYQAFSAVCTHEGCLVSQVRNNQIACVCHRSIFDATTGAVVSGPARSPLAAAKVTESGDTLLLG
jgi:Rieske Fe-S protein